MLFVEHIEIELVELEVVLVEPPIYPKVVTQWHSLAKWVIKD